MNETRVLPAASTPVARALSPSYKWCVVFMLWFVCCFNYADRLAIFSVFPKLKEEFCFDKVQLGLIGSAFMWVYAVGAPLAGRLADRFVRPFASGQRLVQALGLLAGAGFVFLVGKTASTGTLLFAMTCFGACKGFYDSGIFASLYDAIEPRARGTAAGLMNTVGWSSGAMLLFTKQPLAIAAQMKSPLTGIIPPMATPLRDRDTLDVAGLERLVERILAGGVSGLFVLGTTGEGPSLSYRLRRELVERTCRQVKGRVPVLVAVTDTAFVESVTLARHAAEAGAQAVVIAPPYYMPEGQPELVEYLEHLVPELPLPLFLYNMPPLTKVTLELETVRRAMDNPRIVGLKDSSGDLAYFRRACALLPARPDWSLLMGPEHLLLEAVTAGGHGGVNGGANLFPRLYVRLFEAARTGDAGRARQLQSQVARVGESLYRIGRHPSSLIKGIKCALACMGVCDDFMAEPFHRFRAEERALVQTRLKELEAELSKLNL